jgi:mxaA protein
MTGLLRVAVLAMAMAVSMSTIAAQPPASGGNVTSAVPATVEQPRPFGYVVGDLVTQRVLLRAGDSDFDPAPLSAPQRVSVWFERRASRIESAADGNRWLVVEYQLVNAPLRLTAVTLPAWQLESRTGAAALSVPAGSINVAPLSPDSLPSVSGDLRRDREAPMIATASMRRGVLASSIALAATLALWLAWLQWRNWRDRPRRPFAGALDEIRRLGETTPQAWQALHRAFDQTAGRVVGAETLPELFQHAPHLRPLRAKIERFFAQSSERFFGVGGGKESISVRALCSELRRIEKRYAR